MNENVGMLSNDVVEGDVQQDSACWFLSESPLKKVFNSMRYNGMLG
jgi:hypothetical protein